MAKRKNIAVAVPFKSDRQFAKERYARGYEFQKPQRKPSPAEKWDENLARDPNYPIMAPEERRMILGTPHKFRGVRSGNSIGSRKSMQRIK